MAEMEVGDAIEWIDWGDWHTPATLNRAVLVEDANGVRTWRVLGARELSNLEELVARHGINEVLSRKRKRKRR